jgi:potassium-transporting ATPase potassium-binding subunit
MDTQIYAWLQFLLYMGLLLLLTKPMGLYLEKVLDPQGKTFLDFLMRPLERAVYRITGVDANIEQDWKHYAFSLFAFSFVGMVLLYALLRAQALLPLNPQGLGPVADHLAFNTAASFTTNTNWQSYAGESTLSYFSQMVGLTFKNFVSAAAGIGVAAALVRAVGRKESSTIGNFWVDLVRSTLYLLLPLSLILALCLVSQGVVQNFSPYRTIKLVEPLSLETPKTDAAGSQITDSHGNPVLETKNIRDQLIVQGPVASQEAIKQLGTNGGGYTNANSAHPYENPTPLSNFLEMLAILLIPSGLTYYFGRAVKNQGHGWSLWAAMAVLLLIGMSICWQAETAGNPRLNSLGLEMHDGNMEGKEVRFGMVNSVLWAAATTAASNGSVNSMHDSYTPLGGLVPLLNIQLGEVIFGGVGSGLYGMLVYVVLTVFLAGLMIGRTPEYLGKKIEAYDVKVSVLFLMVPVTGILGFTAWACVSSWGLAGLNNVGPHGLTEMLYAFSSAVGNNGSAFAGLNANVYWYDTTLGAAMLLGRFFMIVPVLALAGNLAKKRAVPQGPGSFPVSGVLFTALLAAVVLIVGALTFFPVLSLGPVVEHFLLYYSTATY